jgi:hypothetical protein
MKSISVNTGEYFPWHVKLVAGFIALAGITQVQSNLILGSVLILGGIIIFTTRYYFQIDMQNKRYRDGVSVMGLKLGDKKSFDAIEYLFIKSNKVSRTYNSRVTTKTIAGIEFDGYIKFSEDEKIHLFRNKERQIVLDKLLHLSRLTETSVMDYTREVPKVI